MADYLTTDTELTSVANAIRTKGGTSSSLVYPTGFVSAIQNLPSGGGTDVSDTTAVAGDVLSGKYFHIADGTKVQGTIASKTSSDVTTSNNVVTIPAGHYASQVQKTVGTAQAAQTIHPSTTTQRIQSGKYLTGTQEFLAVLCYNLVPENIKKGVNVRIGDFDNDARVANVTGTYTGGGATGTISITENGTYDVTNYESANVNVSSGATGIQNREIISIPFSLLPTTDGSSVNIQLEGSSSTMTKLSNYLSTMYGDYMTNGGGSFLIVDTETQCVCDTHLLSEGVIGVDGFDVFDTSNMFSIEYDMSLNTSTKILTVTANFLTIYEISDAQGGIVIDLTDYS